MSKKVIGIVSVIVLLIVGGVIYLLLGADSSEEVTESLTQTSETVADISQIDSSQEKKSEATVAGSYIDYQDGLIEQTQGTKVLFFHAPWCPQCRDLEQDITSRGVPDGVTIMKVDFDSSQDLRKKYGVTLQTTVVLVDDSGNLIKKYTAYEDPTLSAVVENLL